MSGCWPNWARCSAASAGPGRAGDLVVLIAALAAVQSTLSGVVAQIAGIDQMLTLFGHYRWVVNGDHRPGAGQEPGRVGPAVLAACAGVAELEHAVRFEGVWFRYHPDQPWVLRELDLTIGHGQTLALVGLNGAGKSTIVKLLCRLYEPTAGRITWDGQDLRDLGIEELRHRIGTVFQDHVRYELTATENIALGDLAAFDDPRRVRAAAGTAGVHEVLAALPRGYDTPLTRMFAPDDGDEAGVILSGGQWQRVALARALLRERADLLILDEPSSGLDAQAECEVHRMLRELRNGRTSLLISHRLNTVRDADRIAVLGGGRVQELGDHDHLMATGGRYAELFRMQSDGYGRRECVHGESDKGVHG